MPGPGRRCDPALEADAAGGALPLWDGLPGLPPLVGSRSLSFSQPSWSPFSKPFHKNLQFRRPMRHTTEFSEGIGWTRENFFEAVTHDFLERISSKVSHNSSPLSRPCISGDDQPANASCVSSGFCPTSFPRLEVTCFSFASTSHGRPGLQLPPQVRLLEVDAAEVHEAS